MTELQFYIRTFSYFFIIIQSAQALDNSSATLRLGPHPPVANLPKDVNVKC